ncbi:Long-chain-fatty-acid--CoA ligase [archaeon HR06]|nr:Long-chain-fatty-acid--CoA ligase [archaeon HR06]
MEDIKALLKRFGNIFVQIYGQAEMNSLISTLSKEDHVLDEKDKKYKLLKSAGKINIGVDVKIVNDKGEEVRVGEVGEIVAKNESLMLGYWNDPELTKEVVKDGWIYTGDLGYIDEEGYLYIVDRKKDVIKSGGLAVYSKEVEDVILKHPAVKEVAVIGVPDEIWGEAVKAIVVLKDNVKVSEEEIIEFCKEYLSSYKKPKSVEFVEALPKNPAGKILKRELREKYWKGMGRRI